MAIQMSPARQRGYSLVEWMVTIVIALFITAGIGGLFVASRFTTDATSGIGDMQETGRVAMHLLSNEIRQSGFFGEYTGNHFVKDVDTTVTAAAISSDCTNSAGEGSLPTASGRFRAFEVALVDSDGTPGAFGCVDGSGTELVPDSMVISVKRVIGAPVDPVVVGSTAAALSALTKNRVYLAANSSNAVLFDVPSGGTASSSPGLTGQRFWEYQHHVYFLENRTEGPALMMMRLTQGNMFEESGPLVEGVEQLRLLFGVDSDLLMDGRIDAFIPYGQLTAQDWDEGRVLAVKLFVLVRALREDSGYSNGETYRLGDLTVDYSANSDNRRRMLLESTISLRNMKIGAAQ